ncbi:MAG: diguanylate cyclase [Gammaproteobacteria bacterium]
MSGTENKQDTGNWKGKYFDCLGDLERRERDWHRIERLLRDAMAHMCVALDGMDPELDRKLEKLRTKLRSGTITDELAAMTRTLSETLDRLEHRPGRGAAPRRPALLQSLLTRARRLRAPANETADRAAGPSASEALLQLLERIELPAEVDETRESLQQRLESNPSDEEWPGLVADIADLIAGVRRTLQREKEELGRFLAQLTERLADLDTCVRGVDSDRNDALDSGRQLDEAVQEQVQSIRFSVRDAVDLDQLKEQVHHRLETIGRHMEAFRHREEVRSRQAEQRISELDARLRNLEKESGELRNRIQRERQLALVDTLTGVPNRMAYEERVDEEYQRWKQAGEPLAMVLMDIDNFKAVNDTYGHRAGDKVLKTIGGLVADNLGANGFLARYGGEEFVLLLPGTDSAGALKVADKLCEDVRNCGFHYRGNGVRITVSCGVATFLDDDVPDAVFERADRAMYKAKEQGRDRCVADGA